MFAHSNASWNAEERGELIEQLQQRLRRHAPPAGAVPDVPSADSPPAISEPLVQTLWNGLIDRIVTADPSTRAPSHEAAVDRLEAMIPGLLDPFSQFRRGILVSLLLGLTIQQTAEQHRCTQRTVHATLQTALELLDTPGLG